MEGGREEGKKTVSTAKIKTKIKRSRLTGYTYILKLNVKHDD